MPVAIVVQVHEENNQKIIKYHIPMQKSLKIDKTLKMFYISQDLFFEVYIDMKFKQLIKTLLILIPYVEPIQKPTRPVMNKTKDWSVSWGSGREGALQWSVRSVLFFQKTF
jgi:hypothetical protein